MAENILRSRLARLAGIARRVPRAIAAALTAFRGTLTRPEAPPEGSTEDLAQFGVRQDQLLEALEMFLEDRAVRPRRLRARFGDAMGTNLLSLAEIRGFINKPGGRWMVYFARIQAHLARHGEETAE